MAAGVGGGETMFVVCSVCARARAGHRRPPAPVRPPFCGYVVRTSLARFGCSGMTSSSIGKCTSSERREGGKEAGDDGAGLCLARPNPERTAS